MSARGPAESGSDFSTQETVLLERARHGNPSARESLLELHRERLLKMVEFRMPSKLARRADANDIVQEALIEAAKRLDEYLANGTMDFYVWLRWITKDRLTDLQRQHFGAQKRDANREVHAGSHLSGYSALQLADVLVGQLTSPSRAAAREEMRLAVQAELEDLEDDDREILILRHFEQLSLEESAQCLKISKSGANKRHLKALRELRQRLQFFL